METLKKNKILLTILILTFIAFVYYFFIPSGGGKTVSDSNTGNSELVGQDILQILYKLNTVTIDPGFFSGAIWMTLHNVSVPLPTDTPGKADLFAPLTQSAVVVQSKSAKKQ